VHRRREKESLEIHRRIASRLEKDAVPVLEKARGNLRRWSAGREEDPPGAAYKEWGCLLETLTPRELARLLVAVDERATRLRQSSPFAGVLPPREVWEIKRKGADAAT
jgi:hypothetical protein